MAALTTYALVASVKDLTYEHTNNVHISSSLPGIVLTTDHFNKSQDPEVSIEKDQWKDQL